MEVGQHSCLHAEQAAGAYLWVAWGSSTGSAQAPSGPHVSISACPRSGSCRSLRLVGMRPASSPQR